MVNAANGDPVKKLVVVRSSGSSGQEDYDRGLWLTFEVLKKVGYGFSLIFKKEGFIPVFPSCPAYSDASVKRLDNDQDEILTAAANNAHRYCTTYTRFPF